MVPNGGRLISASSEPDRDLDPHGRRIVSGMVEDAEHRCRGATYVVETNSTNTLAMSQIREGLLAAEEVPHLVLADKQTSGRGRQGRVWQSDDGSLTFSLIVPVVRELGLLPLSVGVGLARYLEFEFAPLRVRLKWPNDVWLAEQKVAGVLCESVAATAGQVGGVVIGIGLNVSSQPCLDAEPSQFRATVPPTSLSHHLGRPVHRFDVLAGAAQAVLDTVAELDQSPADIVTEFQSRCALRGSVVTYDQCGASQTAMCDGIDKVGGLLVRPIDTNGPPHPLRSGDVTRLRPASS